MDAIVEVLHNIATADHAGNRFTGRETLLRYGFVGRFGFTDNTLNSVNHFVVVKRFGDIIDRAHTHGIDC